MQHEDRIMKANGAGGRKVHLGKLRIPPDSHTMSSFENLLLRRTPGVTDVRITSKTLTTKAVDGDLQPGRVKVSEPLELGDNL